MTPEEFHKKMIELSSDLDTEKVIWIWMILWSKFCGSLDTAMAVMYLKMP
jgi:hypothetical protein